MLGAIIGDIVGSVYEFNNIKTKDFPLFSDNSHVTDDTIMTLAIYDILKHSSLDEKDIVKGIKEWGRMYPNVGYGHRFYQFLLSDEYESYNSYGNGSAMRASACGYLGRSKEEVKKQVERKCGIHYTKSIEIIMKKWRIQNGSRKAVK